MKSPSVSVVIPTYNRSVLVQRAIGSALRQSMRVMEVLVVDDGSSDDTSEVMGRYAEPVRYIYQKNAGVSAARNMGISEARGEWIAFLDSDDEWLPGRLSGQLAVVDRHPQLCWCACNGYRWHQGRRWVQQAPPHIREGLAQKGYFSSMYRAARSGVWFHTSGWLIRRDVLLELGGFDVALRRSEDLDMWWRIAMRYPAVGYVNVPLFHTRCDSNNSLVRFADPSKRTSVGVLVCNMQRVEQEGRGMRIAYRKMAIPQLYSYILKSVSGEADIPADMLTQALTVFSVGRCGRLMAAIVRRLPLRVGRALRRIQENLWQPFIRRAGWWV